jgi:protein gp37
LSQKNRHIPYKYERLKTVNKTKIEWTDLTWNPVRANLKGPRAPRPHSGTFCTRISPGCTHCYASTINKRFGNGLEYTVPNLQKVEFFLDERILAEPLKLRKPSRIFVGDMFDLFHEAIPGVMIAEVLRVAWKTPQHTFQFLTKRADRMQRIVSLMYDEWGGKPREHMWFGVSVEDQQRADERIPFLQATLAAVRFLSVEPLLGMVRPNLRGIHWVIVGGESGNQARPMHPRWPLLISQQCHEAGIPFFFKQWGEWMPHPEPADPKGSYHGGIFLLPNGQWGNQGDWWEGRAQAMDKVGKKNAGALLYGREWREFPASQKAEAVLA